MARRAASWLARQDVLARTVTLKVRYSDFTTITRRHSGPAGRDEHDLAARAVQLLRRTDAGRRPVRLLGVSVQNFCRQADTKDDGGLLPFADEAPSKSPGTC